MAVTKVVMPKLSEQMEAGKVIKWLKKEGDRVQSGDILAEVETDKADVEMEAFGSGVLRKILVSAGDKAPVGALIGVIAEEGDDINAVVAQAGGGAPSAAASSAGAKPAMADRPAAVPPQPKSEDHAERTPSPSKGPESPGIRRAQETVAQQPVVTEMAPRPQAPAAADGGRVKASPLARKIAAQSEVAMDRAWELREELNGLEGQPKISVNDLVIRTCALTLLHHPGVNASFQGESIRVFHRVHMGIAVALEEGLITPVLRDAHAKTLAQIAVEARDLAERARQRKLRTQELSGATFSISNLGMFDVRDFSAIINPPEGAILAVGSVRKVPVVTDEGLGVGRRMAMTISCDHRVMDGAMGARFLQDVKRLLEEPLRSEEHTS